jgi:hypothetical protein
MHHANSAPEPMYVQRENIYGQTNGAQPIYGVHQPQPAQYTRQPQMHPVQQQPVYGQLENGHPQGQQIYQQLPRQEPQQQQQFQQQIYCAPPGTMSRVTSDGVLMRQHSFAGVAEESAPMVRQQSLCTGDATRLSQRKKPPPPPKRANSTQLSAR